jgi:Phage integrase family/Domain of unknown function (DUF4070)
MAFRHALRVSELVNLRWQQIHLDTATIHITRAKNGTPGIHGLQGDEMRLLRALRREHPHADFVFLSERKAPLSVDGAQKLIERLGEAAKLPFPIHAHMLRHAAGYALAARGIDTRTLQAFMGHRSIANTVIYTAVAGDQCTLGCNFDTRRPRRDILADYKAVLGYVFSPTAYAGRLSRLAAMLDRSDRHCELQDGDVRKRLGGIDSVHKIMRALPEVREPFWKTFAEVAKTNPGALRMSAQCLPLATAFPAETYARPALRKAFAAFPADTKVA